mmetsp:Transcript_5810/g.15838  ORF Transcript_5810/g.15838 Transcript_5810/m.15838 type:complete len:291 (-) Transcript_5810:206-1078(-)
MLRALFLLAAAHCAAAHVSAAPHSRVSGVAVARCVPRASPTMGRKFENNKLKMAKTQAQYAKKAAYIGKNVIIAVKQSGPDQETNRALANIIREANALDVSKEVIDRNIKRALQPDTSDYKELTYEAYGHGGVGLIINCLSDNNNRATADVNNVVNKGGCKPATPGSVSFNFAKKGRLCLNAEVDEDALLDYAIEADCEGDVSLESPDPDGRGDADTVKAVVMTEATELGALQAVLQENGIDCSGTLVNIPMATVEVSEEDEENNFKVIDRLEELDDVTNVEHNMAVSGE